MCRGLRRVEGGISNALRFFGRKLATTEERGLCPDATANNTGVTLILALSYGGRLEIIDGIKSLLRAIELGHIDKGMIDVAMFSKHLYTRYYPDPDLLIRTSGEMRLSNFLLWQLSYTEMYVTQKLWPDFTKKDLFAAVEEYGRRQRRYGAVE